ncbi:MAG: Na+/H+ antiporter [Comamonas sp.]|nr:Na+/H+ antiporter [Comamonas sp.]
MHTVETVLLVLMLGALTGIASRYVRAIPLPLIQIAIGALIAWPQKGLHIAFDPELFMLLFIPPLLFADGWRIPKREFFALARPILLLALVLVLFTVIGLGYLIHWMIPSMPLLVAFTLAAVVSPTDAVAVSAITRNLGMPHKTMHMLEGESLLNDASGLVAVKFAVAAVLTGAFSWSNVAKDFTWMALGGLVVGAAMGWGFSYARDAITRRVGDVAATQMVLLLVLLPFASYIVAENIGVSGILAAVAAGIATNFADLDRSNFISERLQTEGTWNMVESAFNGAIFLLLGLQLPSIMGTTILHSGHAWWALLGYVAAISFALLAVRWLWITIGVQRALRTAHREGKMAQPPSKLLNLATTMAGIRGAVTLAAALAIPVSMGDGSPFPERDLLIFLATGVILFTLILGAVTLPWILGRMPAHEDTEAQQEERAARMAACKAAIGSLTLTEDDVRKHNEEWVAQYQEVVGRITQEYRNRIHLLEDNSGVATTTEAQHDSVEMVHERRLRYVKEMELRLHCIQVERNTLYAERQAHRINDEMLRSAVSELDMAEVSLRKRLTVARKAAGMATADAAH